MTNITILHSWLPVSQLKLSAHVKERFNASYEQSDRFMMRLVLFHFAVALGITPWLFGGGFLFGLIVGGIATLTSFVAYKYLKGTSASRLVLSLALLMFTVIFIQQSGGKIECHFHLWILLGILLHYNDSMPIIAVTLGVVVHHLLLNYCQQYGLQLWGEPIMIFEYGYGLDIVLLHAAFVAPSTIIYSYIVRDNIRKLVAREELNENLEERVKQRTENLQQAHEELQASEEELRQNLEELHATQENLSKSMAQNQAIMLALDNSSIVSVADLKGNIVKINSLFCQVSGYTEEELLGENHRIVNSGHHPKSFWVSMWKDIASGKTWHQEVCNKAKDGSIYWVDTVVNPIYDEHGSIYQYLSIRTLITERKNAEQATLKQNQRFELIAASSNDGIWDWNIVANEVYFSDRWKEMLGYAPDELVNAFSSFDVLLEDEDKPRVYQALNEYMAGQRPSYQLEIRMKHKTDGHRWIFIKGALLRNNEGQPIRMSGAHTDITDRKLAEAEILMKNEELQTVNEELQASEEELRQNAEELQSINDRITEEMMKTDEALKAQQEAKNQMVQSEKMASLGQLTAGVAHEINNPVNFISGGAQGLRLIMGDLIKLIGYYEALENTNDEAELARIQQQIKVLEQEVGPKAELKDDALHMLSDIEKGADRVTEIVRGLRNFSRSDSEQKVQDNLHDNINNTLLILSSKYKDRVEIVRDFDPSVQNIECFAGQLSQVFMNIISNGIDAIDGKGTIAIATKNLGKTVSISIKDTGSGMPEEIRTKIFDPFFTTKDVGKGTGLGLSIVHGIIEKHKGNIEVFSEIGNGTEFVIELPV